MSERLADKVPFATVAGPVGVVAGDDEHPGHHVGAHAECGEALRGGCLGRLSKEVLRPSAGTDLRRVMTRLRHHHQRVAAPASTGSATPVT